jgi:adenosylcobyric acid synthase
VRALMVQGACSSAGKSLVATALCRAFSRRGIDVAPFKAQNMSNNARVVTGGEIGAAQYLQALAARVEPDVRMNPVLVKPEGDTRSQVVVLGRPDLELSQLSWRERRGPLWEIAENALRSLLAEHELILLEGAGSPAEINLRDTDLANMRSAKAADARVILVGDIDRGGVFAHLYGTWALLPEDERALLCGFVLNKFRGDPSLLPPGPERLEELTGVPTLGVLPWLEHGLPDEDGAASPARRSGPCVAVIRYPTASNLDEFKLLEQVADLRWAATPADLDGAELVVLPGSKHVTGDLRWLRQTGLADALRAHRGRVFGICGGLQMLGGRIRDEAGVDGDAEGLGLLSLETVFAAEKTTRRTTVRFGRLAQPWAALSGLEVDGYEIRHGRSTAGDASAYVEGEVCGVYVHGLFEQPKVVEALLGRAPGRTLDDAFEALADAVEAYLDVAALLEQAVPA